MDTSLVLGFFDGIHKAHRAVIESAFKHSDNVCLITFKESPSVYFNQTSEYILSRKESISKIKSLGVNGVVELDFAKIAKINAVDYIKNLVETYHPISISTGFNHTFGFNKEGDSNLLQKLSNRYKFKYECVPPLTEKEEVISSSLIKKYLKNGNIEYANYLLESKFILEGMVISGAKLGRTIGFPTANINYPENIVKLPFGVYLASVDGKKSVMNWGMKPTVHNNIEPVAEVHILDFDGDLYGKNIRIEILKQVRTEQKFDSLNELKKQIEKDVKECLKL